jgi:hypothetical protein
VRECPNNDCRGVSVEATGDVYKITYSKDLVLYCNGASRSEYACGWSNWSKPFVYNADALYVVSSMGYWGGAIFDGSQTD